MNWKDIQDPNRKLNEEDLTIRTLNVVRRAEVETVGDLLALNPEVFFTIRNCGSLNRRELMNYILSIRPDWQCNYRGGQWNDIRLTKRDWILLTDDPEIALAAHHGENYEDGICEPYDNVVFDNGIIFTDSEIRYMKLRKKAVVLMYRGEKSAALSEREKEFSEKEIPVLSVEIEEFYAQGGFFDQWLLIPSAGSTEAVVTECRENGQTGFRISVADVTKKEQKV